MSVPVSNASDLNAKKLTKQVAIEYTNGNFFRPFMGAGETSIVQMKVDTTKGVGDTVHFPFMNALDPDSAVTGSQVLKGNEEDRTLLSDKITVDYVRVATKIEQHMLVNVRTPIAIRDQMRPALVSAAAQRLRNDIIDSATIAATPNRTRVLFGASDANFNATLATALGNVDATSDKMSPAMGKLAKRKAQNIAKYSAGISSRKVHPFQVKGKNDSLQEMFIMFLDPRAADDLMEDATFKTLRDDVRTNSISMPYYNGSRTLGMVDGILYIELEELTRIEHTAAGAAGIDVTHNLLCGAQSFGYAMSMDAQFAIEEDDFGMTHALGLTTIRGVKMLEYGSVEAGLVHVFASA